MRSSIRLGKVLGININLHYSWFLIFAFFTFILYDTFNEDYSRWVSVIAGMGASLLLFASVVAHELSHSLVAIRSGIPVKSITLFILGGVAQITREASRPMTELKMAIAGPACSLALSFVLGLVWYLIWGSSGQNGAFDNIIFWLAWINFALALFNLIPGFPLDGGRVLRALIWQRTGNYKRATHIASVTGRGFAYLFIGSGAIIFIASIFTTLEAEFSGIWLVFIGWFLNNAAGGTYRQLEMREALQGFTAQTVMNTNYIVIPPNLRLRELVQGYVMQGRHYFVVADEGRLRGIVTLEDIKKVPQAQWENTPVSAAMLPSDKVASVHPGEAALSVLERMEEHGINAIPVIRDGVIVGIVDRENLLRFIQLRSDMRV